MWPTVRVTINVADDDLVDELPRRISLRPMEALSAPVQIDVPWLTVPLLEMLSRSQSVRCQLLSAPTARDPWLEKLDALIRRLPDAPAIPLEALRRDRLYG